MENREEPKIDPVVTSVMTQLLYAWCDIEIE